MAGYIRKVGERRYMVQVNLGYDQDGRRRRHTKVIRGTKKDAERYLHGVLREKDLGRFAEPSRVTLNEFLDEWLKHKKAGLRVRTFQDYQAILARYVREPLGGLSLARLTPTAIQRVYSDMLGRGLSARTVIYAHRVLSSALKQAVKWRMLASNPCNAVNLPRQQRREMLVMTQEEAARFLEAAAEDRWVALWTLALATGMRPGEYLALQWEDVDFAASAVCVNRSLVRPAGEHWRFEPPKTPRSRRRIRVPASAMERLRFHRRRQNEERLAAGPAYAPHNLVFADALGRPLHPRNLRKRHLQPLLKRAGLDPRFNLYTLRHTFATLSLLAGVNPKVVSEALGHASVTLTLDTYSHVLPDMQEDMVDRLGRVLFGRS